MNKTETYGKIEDGKLSIIRRKEFVKSIKNLTKGRYRISIEKLYNKRSNPQNSYYWAVCLPICLKGFINIGYNEMQNNEDIHSFFKNRYLKKLITSQHIDKKLETIASTTRLTTLKFNEYLENIKQFASEFLGILIPEPNESMEEYSL